MENSNITNTWGINFVNHTVTIMGYTYSEAVFERLCGIKAESVLIGANGMLFKRAAATLMQLGFIEVFHYTQADNIPGYEDLGDEFTVVAFDSEETGLVEIGAIPNEHCSIFSVPVCELIRSNGPKCEDAMITLRAVQQALYQLRG